MMKFLLAMVAAVAVATGNVADAAAVGRTVLFDRPAAPSPLWQRAEVPTSATAEVEFKIALKQREAGVRELDQRFWAVSDPTSDVYGQHMQREEILSLVAPASADVDVVVEWLKAYGITDIDASHGDAIFCRGSVGAVNKAFETTMHTFTRRVEHKEALGAVTNFDVKAHLGELSMPDEVAERVAFVIGLGRFPNTEHRFQAGPAAKRAAAAAAASKTVSGGNFAGLNENFGRDNGRDTGDVDATPNPDQTRSPLIVVPETLANLYNVDHREPGTDQQKGNSISILEFSQGTPSGFAQKNLDVFNQAVGFNYTRVAQVSHRGPFDATSAEGEFTLDPEYVQSLNPSTPVVYETQASGWVYDWVQELNARAHNSQVLSLSAGWSENAQCQLTPQSCSQLGVNSKQYVDRTNTEFMKLGVAGISVLVSAGDSGAAGRTNWFCVQTPDHPVHATFPADSPYVTAIGGTQLRGDAEAMTAGEGPAICRGRNAGRCAKGGVEVVWGGKVAGGATGGGFSDYIAQPKYQAKAVAEFLAGDGMRPQQGHFNPKGRAFPDISAAAINILYYQGKFLGGGGTSFAAPIIAGLIGRLNAERIAAGKPALGHLNPLLYKMAADHPQAFNDITVGDNRASERSFCSEGYGATKGFDPVSGLGSPNFGEMSDYIKNL